MMKLKRRCEVAFSYTPLNADELELVAGETIEILREVCAAQVVDTVNLNISIYNIQVNTFYQFLQSNSQTEMEFLKLHNVPSRCLVRVLDISFMCLPG